jgi:hypothetical protein
MTRSHFAAISMLMLPQLCLAAQSPQLTDKEAAGILALGLGLIVLIIIVGVCFNALFIYLAARFTNLGGDFGTAIKAVIFNFFLSILAGIAMVVAGVKGNGGQLLVGLLTSACAIKLAYQSDFGKAILAALISYVLTIAFVVGAAFVLIAVLGGAAAMAR